MGIVHSVVLGVIQGFTEFLPVSSSAHLYILPWLFHVQYQKLAFDVVLHLGTLVAVVAYLFNDWKRILSGAVKEKEERKLLSFILLASLPGAIFGVLFEKQAEEMFRWPPLIAIVMALFGILLWLADILGKKNKDMKTMKWTDALFIGLSQALAIIPGVSRSGSTITAGLLLGLNKEECAKFSFLLSTIIIGGAFLWEGRKISGMVLSNPIPLLLGFLTSFVCGYVAIWFLLRYLKRGNFLPFAIYRFLFALAIFSVAIHRFVR